MKDNEVELSLDDLEGKYAAEMYDSGLARRCLAARSKGLKFLSLEDVRILISQGIGLKYIVPIAISCLEDNPLVSAGLYRGELLVSTLGVSRDFWLENIELNNRMVEVVMDVSEIYETLSNGVLPLVGDFSFK